MGSPCKSWYIEHPEGDVSQQIIRCTTEARNLGKPRSLQKYCLSMPTTELSYLFRWEVLEHHDSGQVINGFQEEIFAMRYLEGRNMHFQEYNPIRVCPMEILGNSTKFIRLYWLDQQGYENQVSTPQAPSSHHCTNHVNPWRFHLRRRIFVEFAPSNYLHFR